MFQLSRPRGFIYVHLRRLAIVGNTMNIAERKGPSYLSNVFGCQSSEFTKVDIHIWALKRDRAVLCK